MIADEPLDRSRSRHVHHVVHQLPDRDAEFQRSARPIAFPERHLPRFAGRGGHQHAVVRDFFDAPRGGAEHESLAGAALEHHFLVELTDPCGSCGCSREKDAIEAAIGDGSTVRDGDAFRSLA